MTQKPIVLYDKEFDPFGISKIPNILEIPQDELIPIFRKNEEQDLSSINQRDEYIVNGSLQGLLRLFGLVEDFDFISNFLMTHLYFVSSLTLLKTLILFFRVPVVPLHFEAEGDDDLRKKIHRDRIISTIDVWMALNWEIVSVDASWAQMIGAFMKTMEATKDKQFFEWVFTIGTTWKTVKQRHFNLKWSTSVSPRARKSSSSAALQSFDPKKFAYQLTRIEQSFFQRIPLTEYFGNLWRNAPQKAKNLCFFLRRADELVSWVATTIIDASNKKECISWWISVMEELYVMFNFSTLAQIFDALMLPVFKPLFATNEILSADDNATLSNISNILNPENNFAVYRNILSEIEDPPCLPFTPAILSDLTNFEAYPTYLENGTVNFQKMALLAITYQQIQDFQTRIYCIPESQPIQDFLLSIEFYDSQTFQGNESLFSVPPSQKKKLTVIPSLQDAIKDKQTLKDFASYLISQSAQASNYLAAWLYISRYKSTFGSAIVPTAKSIEQAKEIASTFLDSKSPKFVGAPFAQQLHDQDPDLNSTKCFDSTADDLFDQLQSFWVTYWSQSEQPILPNKTNII